MHSVLVYTFKERPAREITGNLTCQCEKPRGYEFIPQDGGGKEYRKKWED
jgi:hypothetical protein